MPSSAMDIVFWIKKTNRFGLSQDADVFRHLLTKANNGKRVLHFHVKDPLEPPISADINIHLEIPVYVAVPWASVNILLVNPEWYSKEWDGYLSRFDMLILRDSETAKKFRGIFPDIPVEYVPWCLPPQTLQQIGSSDICTTDATTGFAWFVGGSEAKRAAVTWLLPFWKESYPPLEIVTLKGFDMAMKTPSNVRFTIGDLDSKQRKDIALKHAGQICISKSESFGYGTAEAEAYGSYLLLNTLGVYQDDYPYVGPIQVIPTTLVERDYATIADLSGTEFLDQILDTAMKGFQAADLSVYQTESKKQAKIRQTQTEEVFYEEVYKFLMERASDRKESKPQLPPILLPDECPPISIITLLYNRRKFFDLACHNIMLTDYPKEKIEWIVVEDSDDPNEDASDRVIQVGLNASPLQLVYVPLGKKTSIGQKRNKGIERAKNDIILFMDDDDHYPETSFRRRVAWLTKHPFKAQCVGCTTIACYDLIRGVSAVNTPPFPLSLGKRISEATLCFYKTWWQSKKFANDMLSEGELFLINREHQVLELPPQQILVAFSHQKNTSGRRIPADDAKPGCFWGFPKEYLVYIHKLVGVTVEEE